MPIELANPEVMLAEYRRRCDVAYEMLTNLIDDIGTGPGLASIRMQALDVKRELRGLILLEARGYVVRHGRESRNPLSWNRLEPFPKGLDFKVEAVAKLREMITPDIITFTVRDMPAMEPGMLKRVHTATLRIL